MLCHRFHYCLHPSFVFSYSVVKVFKVLVSFSHAFPNFYISTASSLCSTTFLNQTYTTAPFYFVSIQASSTLDTYSTTTYPHYIFTASLTPKIAGAWRVFLSSPKVLHHRAKDLIPLRQSTSAVISTHRRLHDWRLPLAQSRFTAQHLYRTGCV